MTLTELLTQFPPEDVELACTFLGSDALLDLCRRFRPSVVFVAVIVEQTNALLGYPTEIVVDGRATKCQPRTEPIERAVHARRRAFVEQTGDDWRTHFTADVIDRYRRALEQSIREGRRRGECP